MMSKKDFEKMELYMMAKEIAWSELDEDDQRVYLREAQKQMSKRKKERGY